jgi:hypothetical protein
VGRGLAIELEALAGDDGARHKYPRNA